MLVDGELVAYVERGGRTVLLFADGGGAPAAGRGRARGAGAGEGRPAAVVEKVDGEFALGSPFGRLLEAAGLRRDAEGAAAACLRATPSHRTAHNLHAALAGEVLTAVRRPRRPRSRRST